MPVAPGVLSFNQKAENRPVEPEQGNACEGKVTTLPHSTLLQRNFSLFPIFRYKKK